MPVDMSVSVERWAGRRSDIVDLPPPAMPADWPNRSASAQIFAGESRWHIQRMGVGPKLLLLHGTAASTHTWRDLMPVLAEDFDVLAVDLPGHGFTDRPADGSMSLLAISSEIRLLLNKLGYEPEFVTGHSAGAAILLRMALDRDIAPQVIVGLNAALLPFGGAMNTMFAPMARLFASTSLMPRMIARRARDLAAVERVLAGTGSHIDVGGVAMYQSLLQREDHVAAVLSMMANWRLKGLLDEASALPSDLHLVCGLNDRAVSPREADSVAELLPNVQITRVENCGHLVHEEQPRMVAGIIGMACGIDKAVNNA